MKTVVAQRCVYHPEREAAARCPGCARFFCRECVSEHEDRVLCARCLAQRAATPGEKRSRLAPFLRGCGALAGIVLAWWFFDLLGRGLMLIPPSVHEGTIWEEADE